MLPVRLLATAGILGLTLIPARAATLDDLLTRMDSAARNFKSYSATAKVVTYTKFLDDTDESTASIRMHKTSRGVQGIVELPSGETLAIDGAKVERYLPKARMVQEIPTGNRASLVSRFLLLGFSSTRDELKRDFAISLGGTETVSSSQASRIVLTPASKETAREIRTIELWIPDGLGIAIQQKLTFPSGDYRLMTFTALQSNPPLPDAAYQFNVPRGTKRVK